MSKDSKVYLHGYSKTEQNRLLEQARIQEESVYKGVDFKGHKNIIEVGSGVGAQTEILLRRFPHLHITCVDMSYDQLEQAEKKLSKHIKKGRVELIQMNANDISKLEKKYDGAFLCWFLEHVPSPAKTLKQLSKILKKGAVIYCTEVQNSSFFVEPYSPAVLKYWYEFNDYQWSTKRHPFVGTQLGNLLSSAGFKKITTEARVCLVDSRNQSERKSFFKYYTELLLSAAPQLIKAKKITPQLAREANSEMKALTTNKNAILFDTWMRAKAYK